MANDSGCSIAQFIEDGTGKVTQKYCFTIEELQEFQRSSSLVTMAKMDSEFKAATIAATESLIQIFEEGGFAHRDTDDKTSPGHVLCMLDTIVTKADIMPLDKMNRWLGFAQAIAIHEHLTTVEELRSITRPIFTSVYEKWFGPQLSQTNGSPRDYFNAWTVDAQSKTIETKEN